MVFTVTQQNKNKSRKWIKSRNCNCNWIQVKTDVSTSLRSMHLPKLQIFVEIFCTNSQSPVWNHRHGSWKQCKHLELQYFLHLGMFRCLILLLCGDSWLGCQDQPAMGAVFIQELASNNGRSWMSQALNLHFSDAVVNNEFSNCQFSLTQNKTCFLLTIS